MIKTKVYSPFNSNVLCVHLKSYDTKDIILAYQKYFNTDVKRFFVDTEEMHLFECPQTKFQFFYPFGLDGDTLFYENLSQKDWYYQPDRWEFHQVQEFITSGSKVLEIGSGSGSFADILLSSKRDIEFTGLELNEKAVETSANKGHNIIIEDLNYFVNKNHEKFDVVCSFQVFEHVSDINKLFKSSLNCLKTNGLLIIAVPNNDVFFLRKNVLYSRYLNMPPHHVNLFNEKALLKIGDVYGIKLETILKEPLDLMHIDTYLYNKITSIFLGIELITKILWKLKIHFLLRNLIRKLRCKITGHTIMVVYRKT